jgi:hypothetical protein
LTVAKAHPGANANALTDNQAYDEASGTAVLFGTPVTIEPLMQSPSGSNPSSDRAITHDRSPAP